MLKKNDEGTRWKISHKKSQLLVQVYRTNTLCNDNVIKLFEAEKKTWKISASKVFNIRATKLSYFFDALLNRNLRQNEAHSKKKKGTEWRRKFSKKLFFKITLYIFFVFFVIPVLSSENSKKSRKKKLNCEEVFFGGTQEILLDPHGNVFQYMLFGSQLKLFIAGTQCLNLKFKWKTVPN